MNDLYGGRGAGGSALYALSGTAAAGTHKEERFQRGRDWARQSLMNPAGMRVASTILPSSPFLSVLLLVAQASAFVDDDNDAIVIEGMV
jgi:hypothetical protein